MLEELHTASGLLHTALERYINACSALRNGCSYTNHINDVQELSDSVIHELGLVESYKTKLTQAHAAVKRARNSLASVPINSLPAEVLTHIFFLVLAQQPCPLRKFDDCYSVDGLLQFPKYPDTLSHVCSRWRQIALASHGLWSHIDIALSCTLSKGFCERAATYAARALQAPLDIHLVDPGRIQQAYEYEYDSSDSEYVFDGRNISMYDYNPEEFTFLDSSPGPHIRSLGLLVHHQYHRIQNKALEYCLTNCLPRGLSELIIDMSGGASGPSFFETSPDLQNQEHATSTQFFLSEQQLESAWHSTTTLVLKGRYPRWTSTAYHGLTELRLLGRRDISGSELVGILGSSPGLRTIHCDFNIRDSQHSNASTISVPLKLLETLNLKGMDKTDLEMFLRCVDPGPGPLRLSLRGDPTAALLKDFCARSNVQEMHVEAGFRFLGERQLSPSMFWLPPQLRILSMTRWGWGFRFRGGEKHTSPSSLNETLPIKLDTLYMLSCHYSSLTQFRQTVATYSPRKLILCKCEINDHSNPIKSQIDMPFLESALGDDLSQLCPFIECLASRDYNPLQDWG